MDGVCYLNKMPLRGFRADNLITGMGIDRMVMFLTNHYSIKEVLTFPFMKDENVAPKPKAAEVTGVEPMPEEGITHK